MKDYCITTISAGEKYNKFLKENILSNQEIINGGMNIYLTTDDPNYFDDVKLNGSASLLASKFTPELLPDVRSNRKRSWFNYHQKRLAIKNAFDFGYTKIFYIDSDIKVMKWNEDFLIKKEKGFWFRTLLPRTQHVEKYHFYDKLYGVNDWHYYRPVSEKIIYINECRDKINGFLNVWKKLEDQARGEVNPYSEGHEILISCRFNGAVVNKYRPDPFKGEDKIMEDAHL
tara:strand:- start:3940 stop:4626 length:687 start_codon:yes stop_codon:yes gene_type:complete